MLASAPEVALLSMSNSLCASAAGVAVEISNSVWYSFWAAWELGGHNALKSDLLELPTEAAKAAREWERHRAATGKFSHANAAMGELYEDAYGRIDQLGEFDFDQIFDSASQALEAAWELSKNLDRMRRGRGVGANSWPAIVASARDAIVDGIQSSTREALDHAAIAAEFNYFWVTECRSRLAVLSDEIGDLSTLE